MQDQGGRLWSMRPEYDALPALKRGLTEGWALKNNVQKGRSAPSTEMEIKLRSRWQVDRVSVRGSYLITSTTPNLKQRPNDL